ncbi:MAG: radical SAM protein, partial [Proteobacteria bacterium]|nr:radical SAM protein [Pseudomonadota bacterium]
MARYNKKVGTVLKRMRLAQRVGFKTNLLVRHNAMKARIFERELRAKLAKKKFRCSALSGDSSYNICINADLSVSCNCDDIYGEGRLGSLRHHTFSEVYNGQRAMDFRKSLAKGKIPISKCVQCSELQLVDRQNASDGVERYHLPQKGIMLETNAGCNLSCIGCGRSYRPLEKQKMTLDELRGVITELADLGIEMLSFFSLGEPFLSSNILDEMKLIRERHPAVVINTSTNGMLVDSEKKRLAALHMDHLTFSIDGCSQET